MNMAECACPAFSPIKLWNASPCCPGSCAERRFIALSGQLLSSFEQFYYCVYAPFPYIKTSHATGFRSRSDKMYRSHISNFLSALLFSTIATKALLKLSFTGLLLFREKFLYMIQKLCTNSNGILQNAQSHGTDSGFCTIVVDLVCLFPVLC